MKPIRVKSASQDVSLTASHLKISTSMFQRLVLILVTLCVPSFQIKFISQFPNNVSISKDDQIGFPLKNFYSGTDISLQAFPKPIVETITET